MDPIPLPILLDGATGTELQRRGMPVGACTEAWVLEHPEALLEVRELDLSSIASVETFAKTLSAEGVQLGGLLNNAGIMNRDYTETDAGFETTLGVNYVNTYLLSRRLLPLLLPLELAVFSPSPIYFSR